MSLTDRLLELQDLDTAADQIRHRLGSLPEMTVARRAREELLAWERTRSELRNRLDELSAEIERAETESAEIDQHRARLEAQLRTVIAPREAEALQHEIATLTERRSALDDLELAALEEQSRVDDQLVEHVARESALREAVSAAATALDAVQGDLEGELSALEARREPLRAEIDTATLARYDRLRSQLGGAVARLVGHRCDGCHLDLSPAEVDQIKAAPADELPPCPQCGRMLILGQ